MKTIKMYVRMQDLMQTDIAVGSVPVVLLKDVLGLIDERIKMLKEIMANSKMVNKNKELMNVFKACVDELEDLLGILKKILKDDDKLDKDNPRKLKQETIRDTITLTNKILDVMKYLYPPVQQNVNVNIDVTANEVIERLKNWKNQEQIVVIGEKEEKHEKGNYSGDCYSYYRGSGVTSV